MLQQLLWWLQEHRSRVFTIMTCNHKSKLPPELYRPGRIDKVLVFELFDELTSQAFIKGLAKSFAKTADAYVVEVEAIKALSTTDSNGKFSPAQLTEFVYAAVKKNLKPKEKQDG